MGAPDPIVTFVLILVIGISAGILFDRLVGPSWLACQLAGSTHRITTSELVGVAGAFGGTIGAVAGTVATATPT